MIRREDIFNKLRDAFPQIEKHGVQSLAIFGSVAWGDYSERSDIDILVDFDRPVGLFDFIRLKIFLEQITGYRVDLVTQDALRPEMKDQILAEAISVYGSKTMLTTFDSTTL